MLQSSCTHSQVDCILPTSVKVKREGGQAQVKVEGRGEKEEGSNWGGRMKRRRYYEKRERQSLDCDK